MSNVIIICSSIVSIKSSDIASLQMNNFEKSALAQTIPFFAENKMLIKWNSARF